MSRCHYKINILADKIELNLSGLLDETFPAAMSEEIPGDKPLVINLDEVKNINSLGIRAWMKFKQNLKNKEINYLNCPKIFIDQVNAVQGFIASESKILSFYVPYFNEDSDVEQSFLFVYDKDYNGTFNKIPSTITDPKGGEFTIDVVMSKYFKFIK